MLWPAAAPPSATGAASPISTIGWCAVTADLFGHTFFLTGAIWLPVNAPQWTYTLASSAVVVGTTIFGFRAIERLSVIAAPLLVALTIYVACRALSVSSLQALASVPGTDIDFGARSPGYRQSSRSWPRRLRIGTRGGGSRPQRMRPRLAPTEGAPLDSYTTLSGTASRAAPGP